MAKRLVPDPLLAAVLANPDDDGPRLVFADALLERGDPRGELIAVQCELARPGLDSKRRRGLVVREKALLTQHAETWTKPFAHAARTFDFARGFVWRAEANADRFAKYGARIFEREPLTTVRLTGGYDDKLHKAFASELLGRLTELDVSSNRITGDRIARFVTSPGLERIARLNVGSNRLATVGAKALASSARLGALRWLDVSSAHIGDAAVASLAASSILTKLETLILSFNDIGDAGAIALAETRLPLKRVVLSGWTNHVTKRGNAALAAAGFRRAAPGDWIRT